MAAKSPARRHISSSIAGIAKNNGPDDPRLAPLREQLAAETIASDLETHAQQIREWAKRLVDAAPPLSVEQSDKLATLLRGEA
jgi:hypothetical protein